MSESDILHISWHLFPCRVFEAVINAPSPPRPVTFITEKRWSSRARSSWALVSSPRRLSRALGGRCGSLGWPQLQSEPQGYWWWLNVPQVKHWRPNSGPHESSSVVETRHFHWSHESGLSDVPPGCSQETRFCSSTEVVSELNVGGGDAAGTSEWPTNNHVHEEHVDPLVPLLQEFHFVCAVMWTSASCWVMLRRPLRSLFHLIHQIPPWEPAALVVFTSALKFTPMCQSLSVTSWRFGSVNVITGRNTFPSETGSWRMAEMVLGPKGFGVWLVFLWAAVVLSMIKDRFFHLSPFRT